MTAGRWDATRTYDVVVVGCGLAGLTAAIALQQHGRRVLALDRRPVAGGLCGTWSSDGFEFVRACNAFGQSLVRDMASLGVAVQFAPARLKLHLEHETLILPPRPATVARLARLAPRLLTLIRAARRDGAQYLGDLFDRYDRDGTVSDPAGLLAFTAAMPLRYIRLEDMRVNLLGEHRYGYHKMSAPVGGPQALTDAMVARFASLGGSIELGVASRSIGRDGKRFVVATERGEITARHVISSQPRWDRYEGCRQGLAMGQLQLVVRKDLAYPTDAYALFHVPPGVLAWMDQLDAGALPARFGFHLFRADLPEKPDHYVIGCMFTWPRGESEASRERIEAIERYLLDASEALVPGINRALLHRRFISPADFQRLHDLNGAPVPVLLPAGMRKHASLDPETGVHHVGNSVDPPGEHGCGAVFSGLLAAQRVAAVLDGA